MPNWSGCDVCDDLIDLDKDQYMVTNKETQDKAQTQQLRCQTQSREKVLSMPNVAIDSCSGESMCFH
jgi:hypothetical protein